MERNLTMLRSFTLIAVIAGCGGAQSVEARPARPLTTEASTAKVVLNADVDWQQLNPARGDSSPLAANLWGNRNAEGPTGFLVRFVDGFESPPHIHNVSYRGVVIHGQVHNAHPAADKMWMPVGSFWTQPKGQAHTTAARGDTVAFIEIDEGPYLVRPVAEAFSTDEKAVNTSASELRWTEASDATKESEVSVLWGDPSRNEPSGILVKLHAGFRGDIGSRSSMFRAVVIEGNPIHHTAREAEQTALEPGSFIESSRGLVRVSCGAQKPCVFYLRIERSLTISKTPLSPR